MCLLFVDKHVIRFGTGDEGKKEFNVILFCLMNIGNFGSSHCSTNT